MIDEFLLWLVKMFRVTCVEDIQHFVTFLSSRKDKKKGKYEQIVQMYHRDFKRIELDTANNDWYIAFIPMTKSGMQIKIKHNGKATLFNIPYNKGALMNVETVHAGGYCNDENGGNLRMQIHFSIDRKKLPLPIIIKKERFEDISHENDIREVSFWIYKYKQTLHLSNYWFFSSILLL